MLATLANSGDAKAIDSLYRWEGGDWIELTSSTGPADRDQFAPGLASKPGGGLLFFSHYEYRGSCFPGPAPVGSACNPSPDPSGTLYSATWSWSAGGWVKETPSRALRTLGTPNALVEDTTTRAVLAIDDMSTVWSWSGTTWQPMSSPTSPIPGQLAASAFDSRTGSIIGVTYNGPTSTPATWRWTPKEGWMRL